MKLKYLIIIVAFIISSCNKDFLESTPRGTLSDDVLNTPEAIELLCISAYAALAGPEGDDATFLSPTTNWIDGDVRAETAYKGGGGITDIWEFNAFETFNGVYATNGLLDRKWFHLYRSVQRANSAIRRLNAVTEEQVPLKNVRLGEMKFLRAHYFFELSRLFNRIPYFDENVEYEDYINISNVEFTRDEILSKISEELAAAAELLPTSQPEAGRATKYAAKAYQAKATLYRAHRQNADNTLSTIDEGLLNEVVSLCDEVAAGGYGLLDDYQHLAEVEFENGKESVFAVQYSIEDGTGNGRINWSNLLNVPRGPVYGGDGFFQPSQNLVNSFKTNASGLPAMDSYNNSNL